ncbi:toxin YdaT family protein [Dickeya solani]|uniref:Toxin YdaT family protein n=1 Tax=Dickeya solani TaxID=1089444 RepID=A0ABU4ELB6_9GAMM|nr:toxin YdaT family protein [Dickeya solani]MCA6998183.1 toxin YdaT domain-containing protein [Dickeya solani]MDV6997667.1 toxin YdaT family protein [Dickeya solani]MDV7006477.1 toxin YdaT family protein [Dickeya solani]MDV7040468.1 toxin YdaT family protein [Dickeya solani]MDV7044858.1 toxin YdaT family protein [Dickeya solani]
MQSIALTKDTQPGALSPIYSNHEITHESIRNAVRAWAANCRSREAVAAEIVNHWRERGGAGLDIPTDSYLQMQKLFRWLDSDSGYARQQIVALTPSILTVMPSQFRLWLVQPGDRLALLSIAMRACSDVFNAALLGAPAREFELKLSAGISSLMRLRDDQRAHVQSIEF